jgi:hypothetical protein
VLTSIAFLKERINCKSRSAPCTNPGLPGYLMFPL